MRAARTACTVAGTWIVCDRPRQPVGAALARRAPSSPPASRTLSSRKNGLPSVRSISSALERARGSGPSPSSASSSSSALSARQRVEPELRVVGLAAPAVLVLGPVVDEQQQPRRRQALDQAVEQRLGLGVDPVQVLEHHEERLHLALAEQQPLDAVERALAALRRVEAPATADPRPGTSSSASSAGRRRLERRVEREQLARHLLADLAGVVARPRSGSRPGADR